MDRKIIGIGAMLVIGMIAIVGIAFAQDSKTVPATGLIDANNDGVCDNADNCPYRDQAGGIVDSDGDGVCDNAANCPMYKTNGGCHGSSECARHAGGFAGGCHQ